MKTKLGKTNKSYSLILLLLILQSCKEYFQAAAVVAILPEVIFGIILFGVIILSIIGAIISKIFDDK